VYLNLGEPGRRSDHTARVQGDHITIGLIEEFVPEDMTLTPAALQALGDSDLHKLRDEIRRAVPAGKDYAEMSFGVHGSQGRLFVVVRGGKIEVGLHGEFQRPDAGKITVTDKARKILAGKKGAKAAQHAARQIAAQALHFRDHHAPGQAIAVRLRAPKGGKEVVAQVAGDAVRILAKEECQTPDSAWLPSLDGFWTHN
jgi:hypothetical protein